MTRNGSKRNLKIIQYFLVKNISRDLNDFSRPPGYSLDVIIQSLAIGFNNIRSYYNFLI